MKRYVLITIIALVVYYGISIMADIRQCTAEHAYDIAEGQQR